MPMITVDGNTIPFEPGQTIIEAAAAQGIDIPHFCWHPELSVSGNCRVCLVEVEKMPKLVIACSTVAADGMVIHSLSENALDARQAVMEFILINHPLDCPICDEAGECKLQDYAYQHSTGESRFAEEKMHKEKRVELGTHVMFDAERCISCSRCIRFCDEIAGETELTFVKRGDRVTIKTFPGKELSNPYSLNVTDICPVGALTNRDFRFKSRVWDMSRTPSICTGCARGCNIDIWVRNNEILRLTPRFNKDVNSYWMCDNGRLNTFKSVNAEDRISSPIVRRNGVHVQAGWAEAFSFAQSELKNRNPNETAFIASPYATVEDNFMLARFAKSVIGTKHVVLPSFVIPGSGDSILIHEDKAPNARGAGLAGIGKKSDSLTFEGVMDAVAAGKIKALYVVESDIAGMNPKYEKALSKLNLLIVHSANKNKTTALADVIFPAASYAEKNGVWVNFQGRAQRIRPAVTTAETDRSLDGMNLSRLDTFGTKWDRWGKGTKRDARATWKIMVGMFNSYGQKLKFASAEEVFLEAAKHHPALKDLTYEALGDQGVLLSFRLEKA